MGGRGRSAHGTAAPSGERRRAHGGDGDDGDGDDDGDDDDVDDDDDDAGDDDDNDEDDDDESLGPCRKAKRQRLSLFVSGSSARLQYLKRTWREPCIRETTFIPPCSWRNAHHPSSDAKSPYFRVP